jgi:hypothetical protein
MSTVFIVSNHDGHYWGRGKRWVDGQDSSRVLTLTHRDEAVNSVFELSSKDVLLRCDILTLNLIDGKLPKLQVSSIPLPETAEEAKLNSQESLEIAPLEKEPSAPISNTNENHTGEL